MRPNFFLHFCLIFVLVDGESCGTIFPDEGESNEFASFFQFMPVDPFSNLHAAKQLQQLLKPSEHKIQEMPGSMDLNAREQHIVVGNNTARMNTSMIESNHHVSLDDGNLEFYRLMEDPMLYRLQEDTTSETSSQREWRDWFTVYALLVVILIAVSPIAFYDSLTSLLLVIVYLASVSLVKVWVKETIVQGFQYPETTTAMHMMAVSLVVLCFERPRKEEALQVLPISALNGASLLLNNKAFLYGGVAFVSMVAANVPFITFLLEVCKGKRGCDLGSVMMVVLVCSGSVCCVRGEPQVSVAAFVLAATSAVLRSARGVWQHELVSVSPTPLQLVFWNGFWSMWITVATMCFSEGLAGFRSLPSVSWEARVALFCSVISAVLLNVTQWFAMKALGALMTSIVGNLNLVLVIALSSAWLHEQVTAWQYLGVMLLCGGTFGNKVHDVLKKASNARPNMEGAENAEKEAPGR